jgi:hypothetical protein
LAAAALTGRPVSGATGPERFGGAVVVDDLTLVGAVGVVVGADAAWWLPPQAATAVADRATRTEARRMGAGKVMGGS